MQVVRDDDEEAGPKVNLETWVRNEGKLYQLSLRQTQCEIADMNQTLGWWSPGAASTIDKIVTDGSEMQKIEGEWPRGKETGVKTDSEVKIYKTWIDSESD